MIPVIEELNGFETCNEEDWIDAEDKDRALIELDIGTTHEVIYLIKTHDAFSKDGEKE